MFLLLEIAIAATVALPVGPFEPRDRTHVPADFIHDQVWVTPRMRGETLRFFTDTGGGWNAIAEPVAKRLGLASQSGDGPDSMAWPTFDVDATIPQPPTHFLDGKLAVAPQQKIGKGDGFLGGRWFADGIWRFDYPGKTLHRLDDLPPEVAEFQRVSLGFQTNAAGARTMHFPSIDVVINGEALPMLYDSGATATTTAASSAEFGVETGTEIGTSFIEHSVFQRWTTANPDWRTIEAADQKGDQKRRMIEVPEITVARQTVGPVWFAEQPDGAFQGYMAGMMDRPTWGALGGSALKYCIVVLDYPDASAYFRCGK